MKFTLGLRTRILLSLLVVTTMCLGIYVYFSLSSFFKDKEAFVYESVSANSLHKTETLSSELNQQLSNLRSIFLGYSPETGDMNEFGDYLIKRNSMITAIQFFKQVGSSWQETYTYPEDPENSASKEKSFYSKDKNKLAPFVAKLTPEKPMVVELEPGSFWLLTELKRSQGQSAARAFVRLTSQALVDRIKDEGLISSFILGSDGKPIFLSKDKNITFTDSPDWIKFVENSQKSQSADNTGLLELSGQSYLYSSAKFEAFPMMTISLIAKADAFGFVTSVLVKTALIVMLLLSVITVVSTFLARSISTPLETLAEATQKISSGDFNVNLDEQGAAEISKLSVSFNMMAKQIKTLLLETSEKARMEGELKTAQAVQGTLFPAQRLELPKAILEGYYQPASECGGDWWFHFVDGENLHILIGDVTGHGAPAALMTAAARATVGEISHHGNVSPLVGVESLNRILSDISQGKLMMTFQWCKVNLQNGKVKMVNAAHETFFWMKKDQEIEVFDVPISSRLGESRQRTFSEVEFQLSPGDRLFFITDGLCDVPFKGNRMGLKAILTTLKGTIKNETVVMDTVAQFVTDFKAKQELPDDVTFVLFEYKA